MEALLVRAELLFDKILWTCVAIALFWLLAEIIVHWIALRKLRGPEVLFRYTITTAAAAMFIASPLTFGGSITAQLRGDMSKPITLMWMSDRAATVIVLAFFVLAITAMVLAARYRLSRMQRVLDLSIAYREIPNVDVHRMMEMFE